MVCPTMGCLETLSSNTHVRCPSNSNPTTQTEPACCRRYRRYYNTVVGDSPCWVCEAFAKADWHSIKGIMKMYRKYQFLKERKEKRMKDLEASEDELFLNTSRSAFLSILPDEKRKKWEKYFARHPGAKVPKSSSGKRRRRFPRSRPIRIRMDKFKFLRPARIPKQTGP
ncbi:hypothetical protein NHQ30_000479 [Ciborinia camelliae]|nr:hypothetical protein NHQ30_000479 [Ciborinia camelliae]